MSSTMLALLGPYHWHAAWGWGWGWPLFRLGFLLWFVPLILLFSTLGRRRRRRGWWGYPPAGPGRSGPMPPPYRPVSGRPPYSGPTVTTTARPAPAPTGPVPASDADREATVAFLRTATGQGRLSLDEGGERIAAAWSATYRHELDALTADLPGGYSPWGPPPRPW